MKSDFAQALRRDLSLHVRPGQHIAFGTTADPYQSMERRSRVTRAALAELAAAAGLEISITTKSTLVVRDLALLQRIARNNRVRVNVVLVTTDTRLARILEPRAPTPGARLGVVRTLVEAGIEATVLLAPVLPGITDAECGLRDLVRRAGEVGATRIRHRIAFPSEEADRSRLLSALHAAYPRVAARYLAWLRTRSGPPEAERRALAARIEALCERYGLAARTRDHVEPCPVTPAVQRSFAFMEGSPMA